jgi:hypothetical protein
VHLTCLHDNLLFFHDNSFAHSSSLSTTTSAMTIIRVHHLGRHLGPLVQSSAIRRTMPMWHQHHLIDYHDYTTVISTTSLVTTRGILKCPKGWCFSLPREHWVHHQHITTWCFFSDSSFTSNNINVRYSIKSSINICYTSSTTK